MYMYAYANEFYSCLIPILHVGQMDDILYNSILVPFPFQVDKKYNVNGLSGQYSTPLELCIMDCEQGI